MSHSSRNGDDFVETMRARIAELEAEQAAMKSAVASGAARIDATSLTELIVAARRLRAAPFSGVLFSEPNWDILLDLYRSHGRGEARSVAGVCRAVVVDPIEGRRWIDMLERAGLVECASGGASIVLTDRGIARMEQYLADFADWVVDQSRA